MPLTNRWNQFIYRLWAPVYDRAFTRLFAAGRRQAIAALGAQPGERWFTQAELQGALEELAATYR